MASQMMWQPHNQSKRETLLKNSMGMNFSNEEQTIQFEQQPSMCYNTRRWFGKNDHNRSDRSNNWRKEDGYEEKRIKCKFGSKCKKTSDSRHMKNYIHTNIKNLEEDVIGHVCSFLEFRDVLNLNMVSKQFRGVIKFISHFMFDKSSESINVNNIEFLFTFMFSKIKKLQTAFLKFDVYHDSQIYYIDVNFDLQKIREIKEDFFALQRREVFVKKYLETYNQSYSLPGMYLHFLLSYAHPDIDDWDFRGEGDGTEAKNYYFLEDRELIRHIKKTYNTPSDQNLMNYIHNNSNDFEDFDDNDSEDFDDSD
jgi:hypothetical protein